MNDEQRESIIWIAYVSSCIFQSNFDFYRKSISISELIIFSGTKQKPKHPVYIYIEDTSSQSSNIRHHTQSNSYP